MQTGRKHTFIEPGDELARLINEKANGLYEQLRTLDISDTVIDDFGKHYFSSHHTGSRLFFSIQSSADIIYRSVKLVNSNIQDIRFIDYGAGLGTLFLLAGKIGFGKVYFNDYFPQWAGYAKIICDKLGITIDDFISGDIDAVIGYAKANDQAFDIVASRNVVEHIYSLEHFYSKLFRSGLTTVCYSTTTANYHNPAMRWKHYWYHHKVEKGFYRKQREEFIKELKPGIGAVDLAKLVKQTRGRAFSDLTDTIEKYFNKQPVQAISPPGSNTCDCRTGVWAEHLITKQQYVQIIEKAGFTATYTAGFWDTHYKYAVVNLFTRLLNGIIKISGSKGYWFAPFVNVVATRK
ncbi:MAG: methyltransferase domain-containing protein [Chitinophagaceae bacterium]|nr:methyltransferase domain-containing protein [Chitinophagaceae bacterium]